MEINLPHAVHSAALEDAAVKATVNGVEVEATVSRLVVELVADDGDHGHTYRLPVTGPADVAKWAQAFQVGATVTVTLTVEDPA